MSENNHDGMNPSTGSPSKGQYDSIYYGDQKGKGNPLLPHGIEDLLLRTVFPYFKRV